MEGKRRPSTGKSTLADVARQVGVSTMTVSRALRAPEKVSESLRERIQEVVAELGYVPNQAASSLASASSRLITLVVPSLETPGCTVVFHTLQAVLRPEGYTILLSEADNASASGSELIERLLAYNPAAIVQYNFDNSPKTQKLLQNAGIPIVEIGGVNRTPIGISVGCDYTLALKMLVTRLIQKGYRNLGLLCAHDEQNIFQQILSGWNSAMLGLNQSPHRVLSTELPPSCSTGFHQLPDLLLTWPELDVLICTSDEVAYGAVLASQSRGIAIPKQLAIVGIGGSELSEICSPALTTVFIAYKDMANLAAQNLLRLLQGQDVEEVSVVPSRLIVRATS
jgi:DNA-binding LacI/PurR family transcriptional regulator